MRKSYHLKAKKGTLDGFIKVTYVDGYLREIEFDIKIQLTSEQFDYIMAIMPQEEARLRELFPPSHPIQIYPVDEAPVTTSDKIALFCWFYTQFKGGNKYKVSAADSGKIKLIEVTQELLQFYFTSDHWMVKDRHSIAHLVRYYNEIVALSKGGKIANKDEGAMPDYYSAEYAKRLTTTELPKYWKRLRELGWKPIKRNGSNEVIDWKSPSNQ